MTAKPVMRFSAQFHNVVGWGNRSRQSLWHQMLQDSGVVGSFGILIGSSWLGAIWHVRKGSTSLQRSWSQLWWQQLCVERLGKGWWYVGSVTMMQWWQCCTDIPVEIRIWCTCCIACHSLRCFSFRVVASRIPGVENMICSEISCPHFSRPWARLCCPTSPYNLSRCWTCCQPQTGLDISEVVQHYFENGLVPSTRRTYQAGINKFVKFCVLYSISTQL